VIQSVAKAYSLQKVNGSVSPFFIAQLSQQDHGKLDVFKGTHRGQKIEGLEHKANVLQTELTEELISGELVDFLIHYIEFTTGARVNGPNEIKHGRLATTRRPSDHYEFSPEKDRKDVR
jgi:hypothetical protein